MDRRDRCESLTQYELTCANAKSDSGRKSCTRPPAICGAERDPRKTRDENLASAPSVRGGTRKPFHSVSTVAALARQVGARGAMPQFGFQRQSHEVPLPFVDKVYRARRVLDMTGYAKHDSIPHFVEARSPKKPRGGIHCEEIRQTGVSLVP